MPFSSNESAHVLWDCVLIGLNIDKGDYLMSHSLCRSWIQHIVHDADKAASVKVCIIIQLSNKTPPNCSIVFGLYCEYDKIISI